MNFNIDDDYLDQEENLVVSEDDFFADFENNVVPCSVDDSEESKEYDLPPLPVEPKTTNETVAKSLVTTLDSLASFGLSTFVAKNPKLAKDLKAPAEAKKEMVKLIALMLPESGEGKIPPWALLALVLGSTYGGLYMKASHYRKQEAELEELRAYKEEKEKEVTESKNTETES